MRRIVSWSIVTFLSSLAALAHAQEGKGLSQSSATPTDARFEVVASPLASRWTFLLDRVTGRVSLLVSTMDGGAAWEDTPVVGLPTVAATGRARFQIFTSGLAARWTFLVDTSSGATWQLQTSGTGAHSSVSWAPMK